MTKELLEKYGFELIDNTEYKLERENLYKEINNKLKQKDLLLDEIKLMHEKLDNNIDLTKEIGINFEKTFKKENLKINDKILFISSNRGYGIFEGTYERDDGYASVKDIKVIYHQNDIDWCSHRVSFNDIIQIIKD